MKTVLITGGSRGIGAATVRVFAKQGYTVILNYNNSQTQATELARQLIAQGCDVHLFCADVSNKQQVADMFNFVAKYFKKLDVLVNNAGIACSGMLQDVTEADYDRTMAVNAKGAFLCCQQALPLLKNSAEAAIVNVASIWGVRGASCESVYAMSKFALVGLTKSLAEELSGSGISVSAICPPMVATDMNGGYTAQEVAEFNATQGTRLLSPDQVAQDLFHLATQRVNGKILLEE